MTWTSSRALLLVIAATFLVPLSAAPHDSPAGFGEPDFDTGFGVPEYDSHAEIATLFVAPFVFIAMLFKVLFNLMLNEVVDPDSSRSYGRITTIMSISVTAVMVPSPAWDYVILAMNSIVGVAIATLLLMMLLIFVWTAQAGSENPRP